MAEALSGAKLAEAAHLFAVARDRYRAASRSRTFVRHLEGIGYPDLGDVPLDDPT
jgi:hypothetical protein